MTVYENASIYIDKQGFVKTAKGDLGQYTYDTDHPHDLEALVGIANKHNATVYLIREFIAVDADYQDHHPKKCAKDWYILEVKPNDNKE